MMALVAYLPQYCVHYTYSFVLKRWYVTSIFKIVFLANWLASWRAFFLTFVFYFEIASLGIVLTDVGEISSLDVVLTDAGGIEAGTFSLVSE